MSGHKHSTSPSEIILLQGSEAESPKMVVTWLGGQSHTTVPTLPSSSWLLHLPAPSSTMVPELRRGRLNVFLYLSHSIKELSPSSCLSVHFSISRMWQLVNLLCVYPIKNHKKKTQVRERRKTEIRNVSKQTRIVTQC